MFTKTDIEAYFLAEKQGSLLFMVVGLVAIALALLFLFLVRGKFYKGAALPLLLIGIIQLSASYTVFRRSDEDRVRNVYAYDANPYQLKNDELPRMKKVNSRFVTYRWIEIMLTLAGAVLVFYFRAKPSGQFWFGLGVTLALQGVIMLGADYMAEQRSRAYTSGIEAFTSKL
jgi:uncharacterized membrane protein HdeD (DUF308 family)